MKLQGWLTSVIFFHLLFPADIIGLWWKNNRLPRKCRNRAGGCHIARAVGSPLVVDSNSICKKTKRLAGRQRTICKREPEVVKEVAKGAKLALMECKYQFRNRKWNCTTAKRSLSKILRRNIRESAFVYAATAAGVVYTVTRACSAGLLRQCSCMINRRDMSTDGEWEWGTCGDNVDYGYRKSRDFMDARKRKRRGDFTTMIQLHNNDAGRMTVKDNMRRDCKCHGLSGSCTLKTCWKKMPSFREIGNRLKERFDGAIEVKVSNDGKNIMPTYHSIKPPSRQDLVYADKSPSFCKKNKKYGSLGTKGRECQPNYMGVGGCDLMCCGRGYSKTVLTIKENCRCRFKWCCDVICETCVKNKTVYRCY